MNTIETITYCRNELSNLLSDEDLSDEKLREASEGLLPSIHDFLNNLLYESPSYGQLSAMEGEGVDDGQEGKDEK